MIASTSKSTCSEQARINGEKSKGPFTVGKSEAPNSPPRSQATANAAMPRSTGANAARILLQKPTEPNEPDVEAFAHRHRPQIALSPNGPDFAIEFALKPNIPLDELDIATIELLCGCQFRSVWLNCSESRRNQTNPTPRIPHQPAPAQIAPLPNEPDDPQEKDTEPKRSQEWQAIQNFRGTNPDRLQSTLQTSKPARNSQTPATQLRRGYRENETNPRPGASPTSADPDRPVTKRTRAATLPRWKGLQKGQTRMKPIDADNALLPHPPNPDRLELPRIPHHIRQRRSRRNPPQPLPQLRRIRNQRYRIPRSPWTIVCGTARPVAASTARITSNTVYPSPVPTLN